MSGTCRLEYAPRTRAENSKQQPEAKRQRIQRMGRVLRITANKENALIVTVYSSKTEYEKLREESNRYQLEGVPVKWQQMSL